MVVIPQEEHDAVLADLAAVQSDLAESEAEVVALESNVSALEGTVSTLETDLAALEAEVSRLETEVAATSEGQLPTSQVGGKWVWSYVMNSTTSIITEQVIGEETVENRDCYVIDMSFDPTYSWTQDDVVYTFTSMK